ncbi:MAG: aminopeptidase P family N-terminal domain-containing protein, partial [Rikenellaceae bacterium]
MIKERITKLREWLKKNKFDAVIIPTNDPHFSEYVASFWKTREWISGFTGSAGTVVITAKEALLWCDSRYFVQSEMELDPTIFKIQKMGLPETPSINKWLDTNLKKSARIAVDGKLFSVKSFGDLLKELPLCEVVVTTDPFAEIWTDRPSLPKSIVRILDENVTGESVKSKNNRIAERLDLDTRIYITSVLDEIAWLLNIRGADVKYNPVVISYAIVAKKGIILFVDTTKLLADDKALLESRGVDIHEYNDFDNFLKSLTNVNVIINPHKFDIFHYNTLVNSGASVIAKESRYGVITEMKAAKNSVELHGMHRAMISDGVALV